MKKRFLMTTVLLVITLSVSWAQDATQRLVVWQKSGEKTYIDLTDEPETTFEDSKLVIKTKTTTIDFHLSNIQRYTYEGTMTAIEAPKLAPNEMRYLQGKDQMRFEGLTEGTRLTVYSLDGKQLSNQTARNGEATIVSLADYPTGTYIVKVNDVTLKFQKR